MIGYGCLSPLGPDDLHLATDLHALLRVDEPPPGPALAPGTVLLSSIRASARFILLNASLGDRADVVQRACDCPLGHCGWTTHLHQVRSFEKLTAGGVTVLDADLVRILEDRLPGRFGGGPTDYQLVEEESRDGLPRLVLRIHPAIGPLDSEAVVTAFLDGIGSGSGVDRVTALQWRQGGWVHVERRPPLQTSGGKVLHLHRDRGPSSTGVLRRDGGAAAPPVPGAGSLPPR